MDRSAGIEPDGERHRQMAKCVLEALLNDEEGRRPFTLSYTDFEPGRAIERTLSIRLFEERYPLDEHIVLHLSNEAINLFLNALAYDIEDAQAATEGIVQSQLGRGRFDEAMNSASIARLQSQRLREKIERIFTSTRRDLSRVDWKQDVPRVLAESLDHLAQRCRIETSIIATVCERRDVLPVDSTEARQLSMIISLMEECSQCHTELHQWLIGARSVFLEEQERQTFALRPQTDLPHMLSEVLEPLLKTNRIQAEEALATIFPFCLGTHPPYTFSLIHYLSRQLQPRRESRPETVPIPQRTQLKENSEPLRYTSEAYERAHTYLITLDGPRRLADLLALAIDAHESAQTVEVMMFSVLRSFDPHDVSTPLLTVDKSDDEQFSLGGFSGDNVLVLSKEAHDER